MQRVPSLWRHLATMDERLSSLPLARAFGDHFAIVLQHAR
jgi:hypothetical protein